MREQASSTGNTWTGKSGDKDQESTAAPLPNTGAGGAWSHPPRLQFVRLSPMAKPSARSTEGAIGYDLYTPFSFTLYPREIKLVYTDIAIRVPWVITVELHQNRA